MYFSKAVPLHANTHIDDAEDELAGALDLLATQMDTGVRPSAEYDGRGFFETTVFSRDNGLAWDEVTAGGGIGKPFPTLVVAASNAVSALNADYTCDGTNDQTEINTAITALGATGGIIHLTEGTFSITGAIQTSSSVILEGSGHGTILKIPDGNASTFDMLEGSAKSNVKVRDLVIDGNRANVSGTNKGIEFLNVTKFYIEDCIVQNTSGVGIYIGPTGGNQSTEGWIDNNELLNLATNGLEFNGSPTDMFVCDNHFDTMANGMIMPSASSRYIICGNRFDAITTIGIDDQGGDHAVISENVFTGSNTSKAISLTGTSEYGTCDDNTIINCLYGINLSNANYWAICGNHISAVANGYGIYAYPMSYSVIEGNVLKGTTGGEGIYLREAANNVIAGNEFYDFGSYALYMYSLCHNNLIMGNVIHNCGDGIYSETNNDDLLIVGNNLPGVQIYCGDDLSQNPIIQANICSAVGAVWTGEMIAADTTDNNKKT